MTSVQWSQVFATNLQGAFHIARHFVEPMIANKYGRIINIASVNGQKGQPGEVNYCSSKSGMYGLTKALAKELAPHGVTVNAVSPGYIATELIDTLGQSEINKIVNTIPLQRLGTSKEVAELVTYLASPNAAYITGADFSINGGLHMF